MVYAWRSAWERRRLRDERCVQRGSCYWNTVREMSERDRLTLSAVRWNTPRDALEWALPGREGGSRIPTLCRKREGEKYNKKREQGKTRHQKATPFYFFLPQKGIVLFPGVLLCKSKCYTLPEPRCSKLVRNILQNTSIFFQYIITHFCPSSFRRRVQKVRFSWFKIHDKIVFICFQKYFRNASPSSSLLSSNLLENQSTLVFNKKFLMHRNKFSSKSWCLRDHFTPISSVLFTVEEKSWHRAVFIAPCSWNLSLPWKDQGTVQTHAVQALPVRALKSPQVLHTVVATFSKEVIFLLLFLFPTSLPLQIQAALSLLNNTILISYFSRAGLSIYNPFAI